MDAHAEAYADLDGVDVDATLRVGGEDVFDFEDLPASDVDEATWDAPDDVEEGTGTDAVVPNVIPGPSHVDLDVRSTVELDVGC